MESSRRTLSFDDPFVLTQLAGPSEEAFKELERLTTTSILLRGNEVQISGLDHDVSLAFRTLAGLYEVLGRGVPVGLEDLRRAVDILAGDENLALGEVFLDQIQILATKRTISPKSLAQKRYLDAIRERAVVFGIGPAGTGKTYLAMAMAVSWLLAKKCKRIVLTRPAVEAGEKLGFLPGDIAEKVNPYLRPLYDALNDMLDFDKSRRLMEQGTLEIAPLAFMRGRTLNDAFIILDEAQNTTPQQMKMFLTRLGFRSKAVITGDVTQVDLPQGASSGLVHAETILSATPGLAFCRFTKEDVVRHPIVARILEAYEKDEASGNREGH